eukprot:SM000127S26618  [mRNA]  locus=s127:36349:37576:- [translate_table: standard]
MAAQRTAAGAAAAAAPGSHEEAAVSSGNRCGGGRGPGFGVPPQWLEWKEEMEETVARPRPAPPHLPPVDAFRRGTCASLLGGGAGDGNGGQLRLRGTGDLARVGARCSAGRLPGCAAAAACRRWRELLPRAAGGRQRRPRRRRVVRLANVPLRLMMPKAVENITEIEIRRVLEAVYGLEVEAVATANYEGKKKRGKAGFYRRPDWKKAYVTLRNPVSLPPSVFPINARPDATASN